MNAQAGELLINRRPKPQPTHSASVVRSIQVVPVDELDDAVWCRWRELIQLSPHLKSPYFLPEFTQAVARVRSDVEIALFKDQLGLVQGIFPFQRTNRFHAEPVGGRLNDIHGVIGCRFEQTRMLAKLLNVAGLKSFGFHAILPDDPAWEHYQFCELDSHHLDLSQGWDHYYHWVRENSSTVKRHGQKSRALERDLGDIRFEFHSESTAALERLVELKRAKYQRTKTFDILSVEWAANLLREIHRVETPEFRGLLSVLWAGDHFVAGHIGMLTPSQLHYWFPIYDPLFSKYSPGTELLLRVAEEACVRGVEKLDLGYGDDPYKFKFANATEKVRLGLVTENGLKFQFANQQYHWRQRSKNIPLKPVVKKMLRAVYPNFGGWNFK